jgi:hypothetical protein
MLLLSNELDVESFSGCHDKTQIAVESSSAAEEARDRTFAAGTGAWVEDKPAASGAGTAVETGALAAGKPAASGVGKPVAVVADTVDMGCFAGADRAADRMDMVWFAEADMKVDRSAFAGECQSFGRGLVRSLPNRDSGRRSLSLLD